MFFTLWEREYEGVNLFSIAIDFNLNFHWIRFTNGYIGSVSEMGNQGRSSISMSTAPHLSHHIVLLLQPWRRKRAK